MIFKTKTPVKVLTLKDPHIRLGFKSPISRNQEEFESSVISKFKQIGDICKKQKVHAIVIPGDIFDIKEVARYNTKHLSKIYNLLKTLRDTTKLKLILTIAGNHDLPSASRGTKDKSVYNFFQELGIIQDIHKSSILLQHKKTSLEITGIDYNPKLSDLYSEMALVDKYSKKSHHTMLLFHEHLLRRDDFNKEKFLNTKMSYNKVLKTFPNIDIFVPGHYHKGYPIYNKDNRVILNPYSLVRMARNYYTLSGKHKPAVNIVTIEGKKIETEEFLIKIESFKETIDEKALKQELNDILDIKTLVNKINKVLESDLKHKEEDIKLNKRQKSLLEGFLNQVNENKKG